MSDPVHSGIFSQAVSPELARVLAQAADSAYAPPGEFFVVARFEPDLHSLQPFNVQPPVATFEEAKQVKEELDRTDPGFTHGVFGPFKSTTGPVNQAAVVHLDVTIEGRTMPIPIDGQQFDALFYSVQAVEKFVIPYSVQEFGPEYGTFVLNEFLASPVALMGHLPWSEEVDEGGSQPGSAAGDPAADAGPRRRVRHGYLPVLFRHDASGNLQTRVLYPRPPADGPA
jgi:hypothetical protein